jgi:hypothetical protein
MSVLGARERRRAGRARGAAAALAIAWGAGCEQRPPASDPPPPPDDPDTLSAAAASARRPLRRYYVEHHGARCTLYWVDALERLGEHETPCPRDLAPGERLRHTGSTCARESTEATRRTPVRCPPPLTRAVVAASPSSSGAGDTGPKP